MSGTLDLEKITPEMLDAGANEVLRELGGAELGGFFSAHDLAERVYRAMRSVDHASLQIRDECKNQ